MLERIKLLFHKASSRDDQPDESVIVAAIERVVDGTDPRLRLIGGYRRKLRKAVTRALAYTHRLVETIPPPVEMGRKTFVKDPHVYAFFASVERLQEVFSHSIPLTEFFQHPENTALNECYAFLVMEKEEKRVFGVELEGEIVKRDVPRIAINFSGHRLIAPGATEAATRQELRERAFNHLCRVCAREYSLASITQAGAGKSAQPAEGQAKNAPGGAARVGGAVRGRGDRAKHDDGHRAKVGGHRAGAAGIRGRPSHAGRVSPPGESCAASPGRLFAPEIDHAATEPDGNQAGSKRFDAGRRNHAGQGRDRGARAGQKRGRCAGNLLPGGATVDGALSG